MKAPLFGLGLQSKSKTVTAKLLTNMYLEVRPEGEKNRIVAYGTPGLDTFVYLGSGMPRGGLSFDPGDKLYAAHGHTLWEIDNAGAKTNRGTLLTGSGRCSLAHNGVQVMIVDGTYGYIFNTGTNVFAQITDVDFPTNPQTVTYQDQYFIVNKGNSNQFYISALSNGTAWAALDVGSAESNPDDLIAVFADSSELMLFGALSTEFHQDTGAADFPYQRIPGAATEWGLAARWSLAKFDNSIAYLAKNRMGQVMVAKLNGYLPQRISTPDIDSEINGYTITSDASAYSYMLDGHPMYQINFPSAGRSWLFDGLTGFWHRVKGWNLERHRGEWAVEFLGSLIVADYNDGWLYRMNPDTYTDNGQPIESEIISENISSPDLERFVIDRLRIDLESGVGLATGQGSDPQISLSVSRDNGNTYGAEMFRPMGAVGKNRYRVEWRRLGLVEQAVFKLRITDPVKRVVTAGILNPED